MVHTITVSIKGSSKATIPSLAGYAVRTAECAIAAEPIPASLEKAALRNPCTSTPTKPPVMPRGVKAPAKISLNAAGI